MSWDINIGDLVVYETKYRGTQNRTAGIVIDIQGLKWFKILWCNNVITSEHSGDLKNITLKETA